MARLDSFPEPIRGHLATLPRFRHHTVYTGEAAYTESEGPWACPIHLRLGNGGLEPRGQAYKGLQSRNESA